MTEAFRPATICGIRRVMLGIALFIVVSETSLEMTQAGVFLANMDVMNDQIHPVNDFEVVINSKNGMPINVNQVFQAAPEGGHPGAGFPAGVVTNNNTPTVSVFWGFTNINVGDWTHIGIAGDTTVPFQIKGNWTVNHVIDPNPPGVNPLGMGGGNPAAPGFVIARATLFDAPVGGKNIGAEWAEVQGDGPNDIFFLNGNDSPVYASLAYLTSPTLIPLSDLNENLQPFGPDGPVQTFSPVPEPATWVMALPAVLFGLATLVRRRRTAPAL